MKASERERLPNRHNSIADVFNFEGHIYRATASYFGDGRLAEIFFDVGKAGAAIQVNAENSAILVSLLLQSGVDPETILHSVGGPVAIAIGRFMRLAVAS